MHRDGGHRRRWRIGRIFALVCVPSCGYNHEYFALTLSLAVVCLPTFIFIRAESSGTKHNQHNHDYVCEFGYDRRPRC